MQRIVLLVALGAALAIAGCRARNPDIGRACDDDAPCPARMHCLPNYDGQPVCMESCSGSTDTTCGDGSLCLRTTLGEQACWVGGPVSIGDVCDSSIACARGGICVQITGEPTATCWQACTPGRANDCPEGERCVTTDSGAGFCVD